MPLMPPGASPLDQGRAEQGVVAVEEARDVAPGGVVVLDEGREVLGELPLERHRGLVGARVL